MKSTAQNPTLPPALLAEVQAFAKENHRSANDTLREIVEQGLQDLRWKTHMEKEFQRAQELELPERPLHMAVTRQKLRERIAQGMKSLREGKGLDGEAVMAELLASLDESESVQTR